MRFVLGHEYGPEGLMVHVVDAPASDQPLAQRLAQYYWPMRDVLPGSPMHDMGRIFWGPEWTAPDPVQDIED